MMIPPISGILAIIDVIIAFVAAIILYRANNRFMAGDFKKFSTAVVIVAFLYLYHQIFQLFNYRSDYIFVSREILRIINMMFAIIISCTLIYVAVALDKFSKKFGFAEKK